MSRAIRIEFEGAYYHITARGNERKAIFKDSIDYEAFIEMLGKARKKYKVIICCYVLMPNHYHIVIGTPGGNLTKAMKHIQTEYAMYYNRRHRRSGHLFQGRYKALIIDKDRYLLELSRYIHLNPLRARIVRRLEEYPWSSYPEYVGRRGTGFLDSGIVLEKFDGKGVDKHKRYREFCYEGKGINWEGFKKDIYGGIILAGRGFTEKIKERLRKRKVSREIPYRKNFMERQSQENILKGVAKYYKLDKGDILKEKREPRKVAIYLLRRHTGLDLRTISGLLGGVHYSAVSKIVSRLEKERRANSLLNRTLNQIETGI